METAKPPPPEGLPAPIDCAVCGKRISREKFGDPYIVGAKIGLMLIGKAERHEKYLQGQVGPYEIKEYFICVECFLRAAGVPEPEAGPEKESDKSE